MDREENSIYSQVDDTTNCIVMLSKPTKWFCAGYQNQAEHRVCRCSALYSPMD